MARNAGVLRLTTDQLHDLLGLPEGCRIHRVQLSSETYEHGIELVLEHPSLPAVNDGDFLPTIALKVRLRRVIDITSL